MSKQSEHAKTLEAWLHTLHAETAVAQTDVFSGNTLLPQPGTKQPLLKSFSAKQAGTSAAPIQVGSTLAEGGMGVVKFAEQRALGRTVVIKTMREDTPLSSVEHVLREAWATGALEHPNIVPVHDIRVSEDGRPIIVLKRIEGDCWTRLMHDEELLHKRFGVSDFLEWNLKVLEQVCQALRFAHSRGIMHRDLKPDNVMIGSFGEVYLVDWGIALSLGARSPNCPLPEAKAQTGMAGTPCYMAPEMLGEAPLDARTDIYLLGGLLFEILAKRPPHRTDSLAHLMADIRRSTPTFPEGCPAALQHIAQQAMAANPADRFSDTDALANALQLYQQTRGSQLLAEEAASRLRDLDACLSGPTPDSLEAYRLFGAVRFGFETALDAWQSNTQAQDALRKAHTSMVEFELTKGNPEAAQSLFQNIDLPNIELAERIQQALGSRKNEEAELEKFRSDSNLQHGKRTRLLLTIVLGTIWFTLPLVKHYFYDELPKANHTDLLLASLAFTSLALGFWSWARASMTKTEINRRISRIVFALFPSQFLLFLGLGMMGLTITQAETLMMYLWTVIVMAAVATVEWRFWPLAVADALCFLFTIEYPEYRYLAMSVANFTFVLNGVYIWTRRH